MPESLEPLADEQVVAEALQNKERFAELVHRYQERLSRYLRRLGVFRLEDIEDVLQNAFLKAYRNLNDFDQKLRFSSWMYRIAHNEAMSFFRANSARPHGHLVDESDDKLELLQSDLNVEREVEKKLTGEVISSALQSLEPKYRDVLVLRYLEERDYNEMSDILKIPVGTVGTQINRAKKRLAVILAHLS
ncbi:MAG: sigma-70 family RNA polymerase sigma factor [Patescibacteria group bacterium]|jgi:RNA polymerase sigma-70 factor (ECF subfamily)